ncbi:AAA family ATPase [Meridianimaribacter flavus]
MKILNITVGGFANVGRVKLSLDKFNALVALNNYGKSNLIKAIEFGIDFLNEDVESKSELMALRSIIPINKHIDDFPYSFEIEFLTSFQNEECIVSYGYSFDWIKNDNRGKQIKNEFLKIKSVKSDAKYKAYIKRNSKEGNYLPSIAARCDKKIKTKKSELIINKLANFDDLFYHSVIEEITNLNVIYIDTLQHPDRLFRRINPKIVRTGYSLNMPNASDVGYFIYSLREKKKDLYELFEDSIKSLLNDIEGFEPVEIDFKKEVKFDSEKMEIPLDFPEKLYDIRVKEINNNQQSSINSLSSGSQKIFYIIALTIAAELNNIPLISFEELENSIHPGLLQRLLMILDGLTEKTKIITSSHSPYLIQYLDTSKIKIGVPNNEGLAIFKEIKKSKFKKVIKIAEEEGVSVGDLIFDRVIECSSGDFELLNELCD